MIEQYDFGKIVIDGISYTNDVIICPDQVRGDWWRKSGHYLQIEDIQKVILEEEPEIVIIGTGKFGVMKVSPEVKKYLADQGIDYVITSSGKAVKMYNKKREKTDRIIGAFHLTC
ncbi:MAG: MTH938/NDUFAF3 family protein [bacterium]